VQVTEAHEPCAEQIAGLKAHLARLDAELYAEIEKEHALAEQLAAEKLKEAELEKSLKKTEDELEVDEKDLLEDKKLMAAMQDQLNALKKALDALKKEHAPCPGIIAGLQSELEAAKAAHAPCDAQIKELKAHLARLDKELAAELEKEEALAKELAEEKRKEAELEQSLKKTKADLEQDERDLAEDKKVKQQLSACIPVVQVQRGSLVMCLKHSSVSDICCECRCLRARMQKLRICGNSWRLRTRVSQTCAKSMIDSRMTTECSNPSTASARS